MIKGKKAHFDKIFLHVIVSVPFLGRIAGRRGSQETCSVKDRETFAIIVYLWNPLTVITKGSILDATGVPGLRGMCLNNSVYLTQKKFQKETYQKGIRICFLLI